MSWPDGFGRDGLLSLSFLGAQGGPRAHGRRGHRQDAHGLGPVHGVLPGEGRGALLHGIVAGGAPQARPRRRQARPGARPDRAGGAARHRRAGVPSPRRRRREAAFQVVSAAHESQSVVFTTNLEFSGWGAVFGDDQMAAAVIDRVVHHGRLLRFRGESYRVRHALVQGGAQKGWAGPLRMLLKKRCDFRSKLVDKTQAALVADRPNEARSRPPVAASERGMPSTAAGSAGADGGRRGRVPKPKAFSCSEQ